MEPTWQSDDGSVRLYLADCMDVLPTLIGVDAVVTDPPYGIGFKYSEHNDTPEGYGEWLWSVIEVAEGVASPGSPVFVFQAMRNIRRFHQWFPRDWRVYAAAKNFVQIRPTVMQYAFDPVVCWWKPGDAFCGGTSSRDWFVADTASVVSNRGNIEKAHPCPRPLDQMCHLVSQWVRPAGVVLDPFCGSGTTGVAAVINGRRFIGVEKDPAYFDIAKRRIQEALGMEVKGKDGCTQRRLFGVADNGVMP